MEGWVGYLHSWVLGSSSFWSFFMLGFLSISEPYFRKFDLPVQLLSNHPVIFILQTEVMVRVVLRAYGYEGIIANCDRFPRFCVTLWLNTFCLVVEARSRFLCPLMTCWTLAGVNCTAKPQVAFTTIPDMFCFLNGDTRSILILLSGVQSPTKFCEPQLRSGILSWETQVC